MIASQISNPCLFFLLCFILIAVGVKAKKDKQNDFDNNPLVIAKPKPIVLKDSKMQSVKETDEVIDKKLESLTLKDTNETAVVG